MHICCMHAYVFKIRIHRHAHTKTHTHTFVCFSVWVCGCGCVCACDKQDMVKMPGLKGKDYGKATTKYPDFTATENGNNDVFIHT